MSPLTASPIAPLDVPSGVARVLLVGGTFDPPHAAHRDMALAARMFLDDPGSGAGVASVRAAGEDDRGEPTRIVFVPAARSPFKPAPIADDALRIEMLRALAGLIPGAGVWTDEIDRSAAGTPSFWVDTLERAHEAIVARWTAGALPDLHFLIGADQAIALHRWRSIRRVLELARPVIVLRPPVQTPGVLRSALLDARFWCEGEIDDLLSRLAPAGLTHASSSAIRAALAARSPTSPPDLPDPVRAVLERTNPYAKR